ncbi:MAG: SGNH/GDSL hydrolase family protein [Pseudomonadota bacterium]|nr:SGNH/GDSL hydrolase family protein [Pseudomonadota bacterium]
MAQAWLLRVIAAALTIAGAACASTAPPEKVERIVAFGDSYVDDGNIFRLFGVAPPRLYPQGRFSDGTNFVDTMAEMLRVPVANFALGGAVTGPGKNNRPAGFDTETKAFLAGGGPPVFPRTSGRFGPRDLVVVSIGGNDARAFEKSFGAAPGEARIAEAVAAAPAAADKSIANATRGLDALAAAGARNILFLGGDVGRLPEVKGRAIARIGSAYSAHYNAGMRAALARLSRRGVAAHYLDLDVLGDRIEADPRAFGLISAGACPEACLSMPALRARYLFHADKLHLSAAGHAIVGRYAVAEWAEHRTKRH